MVGRNAGGMSGLGRTRTDAAQQQMGSHRVPHGILDAILRLVVQRYKPLPFVSAGVAAAIERFRFAAVQLRCDAIAEEIGACDLTAYFATG